jgi:hypothetical protein
MSRIVALTSAVVAAALFFSVLPDSVSAGDAPADRVVAMYFHRTIRCPTCLRMGSYTEEAVKSKFADQLKDGKLEFHFIDFQDKKNEELTKGYKVSGPALVVAKVEDNKVKEYKNLKDIWAKNTDKAAFMKYVQDNISAYEGEKQAAQTASGAHLQPSL